ncbi:protein YIF1A-like isoform X2 [Hylaeus volcanicus]|nr:protein YIF1A-like isoform X2 [Hylaeus volcanicus]XP_053990127.1 protein YIF1A-like isoform X2 [Hylaeus volcanicus]
MAFTTYVLLCGLTQGALQEFHPQIFSSTASYALILIIFESAVCIFGFYLIGAQHLPILDVLSILGLKFEGSVVIVIIGLLFRHISYVFWAVALYCSLCASNSSFQWIKKCEKCNQTHLEWKSSKMNATLFHYFTIVISIAQILFTWFLIPSLLKKAPKV